MIHPKIWIRTAGALSLIMSIAFIICALVAAFYGETPCLKAFSLLALVLLAASGVITLLNGRPKADITLKDGFIITAFSWIFVSVTGAFPLLLCGCTSSFADAFFEICSGFSTTGSSIFTDVEILPRSILFWRSLTHWMGGMGVLLLATALFKGMGSNMQNIIKAESPGPSLSKLLPRISDTAKVLYGTYIILTILEFALLLPAMSPFDSMTHTFATVGTGGFSCYNDSLMHFDSYYVDTVVTVFMLLSGVNFGLYFLLVRKEFKAAVKDEELLFYLKVFLVCSLLITAYMLLTDRLTSFADGLSKATFQVASIMTTTGFATTDFALWPSFCLLILFCLLFLGGCASSTAGGIKAVRALIVGKITKRHISRLLHPNAMVNLKINGRQVEMSVAQNTISFIFLYIVLFFIISMIVAMDGKNMVTTFSATATCLGNVGPGFGEVGPMSNFSGFSDPIKIVLAFTMLCGRLELFPLLMIFSPRFWREG